LLAFHKEVWAQDGHIGHGHDKWHKGFYDTLQRPDTRGSCCNLTDCRPTQGRVVGDHYEIKVNGAWVSVPADKVVKKPAPDMGFHVCAPYKFDGKPENLYCVVLPPET
jgi:hypothetical protein